MFRTDFLKKVGLGTGAIVLGFHSSVMAFLKEVYGVGSSHTLGLDKGLLNFDTPDFHLKLVKDSQTVAALMPKGAGGFDFTPSDWLDKRSGDGFYHLGDVTMRIKSNAGSGWNEYSTAVKRKPVKSIETAAHVLAAAELNPSLPNDIPLTVRRFWKIDNKHLVLSFELENTSGHLVEVGSLGIPMIFNNILTGRKLSEAHRKCCFYDPYIGQDAGYLQVTRLIGHGPALIVVPEGKTSFEAYNPLLNDKTKRGITFEGFYEWMVHTKSYVEKEWEKAEPWNEPTSDILDPGQKRSYGVRFLLSGEIRNIEKTLIENDHPVAAGIPGYILPGDQKAQLFLNYSKNVRSMRIDPIGSLKIEKGKTTENGWKEYRVEGSKWGRSRLTVEYDDGLKQTIHYKVIKPQFKVLADLGSFLVTRQWFDEKNDLFDRNPSFISYDYFEKKQVTQEKRAWIAGLSDEGGNGSWVVAMMKQFIQPDRAEIKKLEEFVDGVLWGRLQYKDGDYQYGVRKSLFYYQPDAVPKGTYDPNVPYGGWASWDKKQARSVGRSYDYTPVAAAYWVLYRLARNHNGLVTNHPWDWYLKRSYDTAQAMVKYAPYYSRFGQMEGTVFVEILRDLRREGWHELADQYETKMKKRADVWKAKAFPFGSEMPWDSTGQEEVYAWCRYFGYDEKAEVTLKAITGYMPTIAHWGYNGNARRYWDFLFAGKLQRIERQIHHYGSGLNAIPVLTAYRDNPDDFYLLRVGYGGLMGAISNITKDGFGPCAFHSYPSTLEIDGYSGDYGPNFLGHVINTGTYVVNHPEFGWLAFGGDIRIKNGQVEIKPLDSSHSRIYLAPMGLWLTLDAGKFDRVVLDTSRNTIVLFLERATGYTTHARLRVERPSGENKPVGFKPSKRYPVERDAYVIPLGDEAIRIDLVKV